MLNKFREYLISSGVQGSTADVYLSILRNSSKRRVSKIAGWSTASQWAAKFILNSDERRLDVPASVASNTGLCLVGSEEPVVVHVFSEDTIEDICNVLTMQLDAETKLQIIETYIKSRRKDLGVANGTR